MPGFSEYANPNTQQGLAILNEIVNQEALMAGYLDDFRAMMLVVIISLPLLALLRPAPRLAASRNE